MISQKPAQFVASGGVQINLKSHLKFYPTSGPGMNRVEIETRSDNQRTEGDARDDARTMNPMSGARQAITRKKTSASDRTVLNFVNHRTAPTYRTHRPATGLSVSEA
ncbi:hypothetical protein DPMN_070141 [Dreissena polymorpha]|uniref:Uncharacterized protein n=1 Tax=Dreissena polymorpha TaxID=45954 RepID=A0A9D3Z4J3_DREPO|nr:hypothetical protein DPMN_070141 [Dreissena polymorpha]